VKIRLPIAAALAALALQGCAWTRPLYRAGAYDELLHARLKSPEEKGAFTGKLKAILAEAERAGALVPPGLHAEYGYALYQEGQYDAAVAAFERELARFPESRPLLETLIRDARRKASPSPPQGRPGDDAGVDL
jgi:hypothetical protein